MTNYDIKIINNQDGKGKLELGRIEFLAKRIRNISKKALLLHLFGYSKVSMPGKLNKYLNIYLSGQSVVDDATAFTFDAENFSKLPVQLDAFWDKSEIRELTPVSLVIATLRAALLEKEDKNQLDEPLIDELIKFKSFFQSDNETLALSNRGTVPEIYLGTREIDQIEHLYKNIPDPQRVVVNGRIDEMKFSKKQLILLTENNHRIVVVPQDNAIITELSGFFGKEVTLSGMAHFKPGGDLSCVRLESFGQPGKGDRFFSKRPEKMGIQQKIALQLREGKKANPLDDIIGKWPGDETDEEFEQMLKELD